MHIFFILLRGFQSQRVGRILQGLQAALRDRVADPQVYGNITPEKSIKILSERYDPYRVNICNIMSCIETGDLGGR